MKHHSTRRLAVLLCAVILVLSSLIVPVSANTYSFPRTTVNEIVNSISNKYSPELANSISDLLYDSDYSDFINYTETFRGYESLGNKKSWPITNADDYGTTVYDRGKSVNWGAPSKGCFSYANFFSKSVYGTRGARQNDSEWLTLNKNNPNNAQELKVFLRKYAQPGEHLRINDKHSVVFLTEATKDGKEGFYVAEYWGGGRYVEKQKNKWEWEWNPSNDQFYIRFFTYDSFIAKYDGRDIYMYNAYETSDYIDNEDDPVVVKKTRDIVMVLDVSGSMGGSRITNTKEAAKQFVDYALTNSSTTRIALVTFESSVKTVSDFTNDSAALCSMINSISATGNTAMYGGLERAGELLASSTADKKAIVIMGDGDPNVGTSTTSSTITVDDGTSVYFTSYGTPIYNLAETYKNTYGYTIYSFGFGLSVNSSGYNLLKYIASRDTAGLSATGRFFWADANVNDIEFVFMDIIDTIVTRKNIIITIDCPVEASVTLEEEILDDKHLTSSFGSVSVTQNGVNDRAYVFTLDAEYADYYYIEINGIDDGTMNLSVRYNEGDESQNRTFTNVPVSEYSIIHTSSPDSRADFLLYVDNDGDDKIDEIWDATVDETVTAPSEDEYTQLYPDETVEYTEDGSDKDEVLTDYFTVETVTGAPGDTVTVNVSLINPAEIKAIMFEDFEYDRNVMGIASVGWYINGIIMDWDAVGESAVIGLTNSSLLSDEVFYINFVIYDDAPDGDYSVGFNAIVTQVEGGHEMVNYVGVEKGTVSVLNYLAGDMNDDGDINSNDAIYLLRHTMNSFRYPINQPGDVNDDLATNSNDAIYLLRFTMNPTRYPLHPKCNGNHNAWLAGN